MQKLHKEFITLQLYINHAEPYQLPQFGRSIQFQSMIGLANLARNSHLRQYTLLNILQSLTRLVSPLVGFKEPTAHLAALDRKTFYLELYKKGSSWSILRHMVFGIYPEIRITAQLEGSVALRLDLESSQDEFVGNPNWKITRKIITRYYDQAPPQHQECLEILLALPQLKQRLNQGGKEEWRSVWTYLYLMANNFLTCQPITDQFQLLIEHIDRFLTANREQVSVFAKITLHLVAFIAKKSLFQQTDKSHLQQVGELLLQVRQEDFPSKSLYFFTQLLMKDLFKLYDLTQASNHCEDIIMDFKKGDSAQKQTVLLRSYLMSKEELPEYLLEHGLAFWEYGLDRQANQLLAENYLRNSESLPKDFEWNKVFQHLSQVSLKQYILNAIHFQWTELPWGKPFINLCKTPYNLISKKIYQGQDKAELQLIESNLRQFCKQWTDYSKILHKEIASTLAQVKSLLTFKANIHPTLGNCLLFPQNLQIWFARLCTGYLRYLVDHDLVNEEQSLLLSPELAQNLIGADTSDYLDEFWEMWTEILLSRDSSLLSLLTIQNPLDYGEKMEEQQIFQEKEDHLYLRTD